jgi:hypothetical protein
MNLAIAYRGPRETTYHTDGTLISGLSDGLLAIGLAKDDKGNWNLFVSLDRNGTFKTATSMGQWEGSFVLSEKTNVLSIQPNVVTYNVDIYEL